MKSVLISIRPEWCEKIASGEKTVEIRKTRPKLEPPFKVYVYQTQYREHNGPTYSDGKVIGEFVCRRIDRIVKRGFHHNFDYCYQSLNQFGNDDIEIEITDIQKSCISKKELNLYGESSPYLLAWHISDLVIYEKPRPLSDFKPPCDGFDKRCQVSCAKITTDGKSRCTRRQFTRPPQSWCYVEEVQT